MKKTIFISMIAVAVAAGAVYANCGKCAGDKKAETVKAKAVKAEKKDCADCPMHKKAGAKKCSNKMCPEAMEGVETAAKDTPTGVEITMTAKDAETIAKLQELTLVHYSSKDTMDKECPARVEGAESKIENTATGVKILLTGKTPAAIKKIQAASAKEHMKAGCPEEVKKESNTSKKYTCAMKCVEAAKPGKCPKCGMPMTEKK